MIFREIPEKYSISQQCIHALAAQPMLFDALRWILEAGFKGERAILRKENALTSKAVLDLGCGTGILAGLFEPASYLGIDMNPHYIVRAQRMHPDYYFRVMDGQQLDLPTGMYDMVIIGGVIHHVGDREAVDILSEVKRVLQPLTGRLVMWEDVRTQRRWNLIGKFIQRLDVGEYIRTEQEYLQIVRSVFTHVSYYPMSSGVCDYIVISAHNLENEHGQRTRGCYEERL